MKIIKNRYLRTTTFIIGFISVIAAFLGLFLPLVPTTPFLLLSAWCFLRSSPKAHVWLYRHKYFGPALIFWQEKGAITRPAKYMALGVIASSLIIIWLMVKILWLKVGVTVMLFSVTLYVITRPSV